MPYRDPALWYARRLRETHPLPFPATLESLLALCDRLGVGVEVWPGLSKGGHYWAGPEPLILVREPSPFLVGHEFLHHLALDREAERGVFEESVCDHFAWLLCSGTAQARALLEIDEDQLHRARPLDLADAGRMLSAVVYCWAARQPGEGGRKSTNEQERFCEAEAERDGRRLVRVYRDYGNPLRGDVRPQGAELSRRAGELRERGVGAVYLVHESRFGPTESLRRPMVNSLAGAGLEVRSLDLGAWRLAWR